MSARAQEFLDNWIAEFVATGQSPSADLASIAIEEAADEGIGDGELRGTVDGDLQSYIAAQLARVQTEEDEDAEDPNEADEA